MGINQIYETIQRLLEETFHRENEQYHFAFANGTPHLTLSIHHNHPGDLMERFAKLVDTINGNAPGSYGIFYLYDDENQEGHHNEFQVFILKRGTLTTAIDKYLSPVVPTIEDPL